MAYGNDENVKRARELRRQGKTVKYISEVTGLSEKTIFNYTCGCLQQTLQQQSIKSKMDYDMQVEWTQAVNRIRKYYGRKPFPMPYPEVNV